MIPTARFPTHARPRCLRAHARTRPRQTRARTERRTVRGARVNIHVMSRPQAQTINESLLVIIYQFLWRFSCSIQRYFPLHSRGRARRYRVPQVVFTSLSSYVTAHASENSAIWSSPNSRFRLSIY